MVINDTQRFPMGHVHNGAQDGFIARFVARLGQFFCGLFHGHHSVLHLSLIHISEPTRPY